MSMMETLRLQRELQAAALENRRLKSCLDKERTRQTVNQQTFGALQEENRSLREQLTSRQGSINTERDSGLHAHVLMDISNQVLMSHAWQEHNISPPSQSLTHISMPPHMKTRERS
mmetsp:Transcript_25705/g.63757  ORF Transcript_25705/g.63757 Transcript_25705/m.63757 type:complete len:116 (-) Transcript_25705:169-516(-)